MQTDTVWSSKQKSVVAMLALALLLDGLDAQVLGLVIPALIQEWGVTRADFAPIAALSLIGMALGATFGGWLGDRVGRRAGVIGSLLLFGLATALASQSNDLFSFGALRAVAGLGLGAILPNATAMIADFTPDRYRSIGMSIAIFSQPLGAMLAGVLAAGMLETVGWRWLFVVGGLAPIVVGIAYIWLLPEAPHMAQQALEKGQKPGFRALLGPALRGDTLLASIFGFMAFLALYMVLSWGPSMLASERFPLSFTGTALAVFSFGGIGGSIICGLLLRKLGSRAVQLIIGGIGIAGAIALCVVFATGSASTDNVLVLMAVIGFSAAGSGTTLYAQIAHLYPPALRGTGMGVVLGLGRLGAVASAYVGSISLDRGGAPAFFVMFAVAVAIATLACVVIRRPTLPVTSESRAH